MMHQVAPRKYYLLWTDTLYEQYEDDFESKDALLAFVNERAGHPEFKIVKVIYGVEITLKPIEIVKGYALDD